MSLAAQILDLAKQSETMIATAESCTGGMVMAALTDIAGSSAVAERGFVTYTNNAKMQMLGVSGATLDAHGAVSEEIAAEMAKGALRNSEATLSVSITGIAGPGGSDHKPLASLTTKTAQQRLSNLGRRVGPMYVKRHVIMRCKCYWIG